MEPEPWARPAPDQSLIERARSGDQAAFQALIGPLIDPGYQLAVAMLRQREAAEDAVQATIRAWRKFGQVRDVTTSLRPWFPAIVANECRTLRRIQKKLSSRFAPFSLGVVADVMLPDRMPRRPAVAAAAWRAVCRIRSRRAGTWYRT
jgi:DNA-directed RNA polymerase specialized sigma24 family protein